MFQLHISKRECVAGTDPAAARSNAQQLFKAMMPSLTALFSGNHGYSQPLDRELKDTAPYAKHGIVLTFRAWRPCKPVRRRKRPRSNSPQSAAASKPRAAQSSSPSR